MPFEIVRNDITKMKVDAAVNAANPALAPGGGVCGSIHRAAGPALAEECAALGGCETGMAKATRGYNLPCRYIIHTVGPVWKGGNSGEREALASCYRESLSLAQSLGCGSIAFPLISSGIYGYPGDRALKVATETIEAFLAHSDMTVYLVVFDKKNFSIGEALYADIAAFIDDAYVREFGLFRRGAAAPMAMAPCMASEDMAALPDIPELDESFSQRLLRMMDERGMSAPECYKKANVDKKLFSKIKNQSLHTPAKTTVLAFAVALRLDLDDTRELLDSAGYSLSRSKKLDVIVEYFISRGKYDIFEINEALFAFDQSLLGGKY